MESEHEFNREPDLRYALSQAQDVVVVLSAKGKIDLRYGVKIVHNAQVVYTSFPHCQVRYGNI
jgi:hypothetical protein